MTIGVAITYKTHSMDVESILQATEYEIDLAKIRKNEIALRALANPINPSDVLQLKGVYAKPKSQTIDDKDLFIGGNEGLYEIVNVGENVNSTIASSKTQFNSGDWVITTLPNFGTWRSHLIVKVNENEVIPVIKIKSKENNRISLEQAATIGVNPPTALQMIENFVDFQENKDWIIQNAGASQVSKFVLQFGKIKKVNTISVIRSGKSNQSEIEEELKQLGATKVITEEQSQSEEFRNSVLAGWLKETGGKIKLALNSVGGDSANALFNNLSNGGYLVTYGQMDPNPISYTGGMQLFKDITTKAYWFSKNTIENPQSKIDTIKQVVEYFESGQLQAVPFVSNEVEDLSPGKVLPVFLEAIKNSSKGKQVIIWK